MYMIYIYIYIYTHTHPFRKDGRITAAFEEPDGLCLSPFFYHRESSEKGRNRHGHVNPYYSNLAKPSLVLKSSSNEH